jgi:uncharacterized protein (TIGR02246 family)
MVSGEYMNVTQDVERELRSLVRTFVDAWNRGDGDGFASVFADDADFTSINLTQISGRASIAASHNQIFATVYNGTRVDATLERVRPLREDLAVLDIDAHMTNAAGEPFGPKHMHPMAVAERQADGWRIVAFQNMEPVQA